VILASATLSASDRPLFTPLKPFKLTCPLPEARPVCYYIHCQTDRVWWDRPAWNPRVRFEQPQTIMQGAPFCLFIQTIPE